ncbi:MAG: hypothetical protein ACRDHZ_03480 [Ktedonobacteraceae bacterium]
MKHTVRTLFLTPFITLAILLVALAAPLTANAATTGSAAHFASHAVTQHSQQAQPFAQSNLIYHSPGPVQAGTANWFAIFWQPTNNVSAKYHSLIEQFFGDIGGSAIYHNNTQYTQAAGGAPSNVRLAGTFVDTRAYPESPLLDSDIQAEVTHAQSVNGWTSATNNTFFVFLQRNQDICFDSTLSQCASNTFCAYHSMFGTNTVYATMPYAASFSCRATGQTEPNGDDADLTINVSSHEGQEAATDPFLNAWFDSSGNEIGDKCNFTFGPLNSGNGDITINGHTYEIQREWDNHARKCVMSGP